MQSAARPHHRWLCVLELCALLALFALAGCFDPGKERSEQQSIKEAAQIASRHNSELIEKITPAPQPVIVTRSNPQTGEIETTITPAPSAVDVRYTEGQDVAASERSALQESEVSSYPFFVKLIGICVGVACLLGIVWYLRRASLAVKEVLDFGDASFANVIRRKRAQAQTSTDQAEIARQNVDIAALEAERGRLKS